MDDATIAAIATPPGTGGIGVVRLSGEEAAAIAGRVFRLAGTGRAPRLGPGNSHRLFYGRVIDLEGGAAVDEALLAWMAAPRTYTREDTVEFSCHGGPVAVRETLRVVLAAGARAAGPGEFTLRAFLNGRLDLTQSEAVLNVVGARTADGLRLAVADLAGDLGRRLGPARDALVGLLAYLDAAADFPDDEIPPFDVGAGLAEAEGALAAVVAGAKAGMLYREGAQVALVGRPNVGKSSLLNALLRSERAIVTPIAGTTRDIVAETADPVERLGVQRSRRALDAAAGSVLVLDGSLPPGPDDLAVARALAERAPEGGPPPVVVAVNKFDLPERADQGAALAALPDSPVVAVSSKTGDGLADLERALSVLLGASADHAQPALITARQRAALDRALAHVRDAAAARLAGYPLDLLATDVRAALRAVGAVTGEAVDEAVLTEIFARFCIGK